MSVTVVFGEEESQQIYYEAILSNSEQEIRGYLEELGYSEVARLVAIVGGNEVSIRGNAHGLDYRAYLPSFFAHISRADTKPILSRDSAIHSMQASSSRFGDDAEVSVTAESSETDVNSHEQSHLPTSDHDNELPPQSFAAFNQSKVSSYIRELDLLSLMSQSEKGKTILEFARSGGDLNSDRTWRPRLIRFVGKLIMIKSTRQYFPSTDEFLCALEKLQMYGMRLNPEVMLGYFVKFAKNQRMELRKAGMVKPSAQSCKRNEGGVSIAGLDMAALNQKMQGSCDGSIESKELMSVTRFWRMKQGRADLGYSITQTRQIVEWPQMTIGDAENTFNVSFESFFASLPQWRTKIREAFRVIVRTEVQERLTVDDSILSTLKEISACLDSMSGKARRVEAVSLIYREFEDGTLSDALLSISNSGRGKRRSSKINHAVQPSMFKQFGCYYIALCGRELRIGDGENDASRCLFILLSLFMFYDLSYPSESSDIHCFLEMICGFPSRKGRSLTAIALYNRVNQG